MRLFVAVEIDASTRGELDRVQARLRRRVEASAPRARLTWVAVDRLHVTLRFIGEVSAGQADAIGGALAPPIGCRAFTLTIGGVGTFPLRGSPRVIWVGIRDGQEAMAAVHREVSIRLEGCGVPPDARDYHPHLTLARIRDAAGLRARDVLEGAPQGPLGVTPVEAITLFESRVSSKGPAYLPLRLTPLQVQHS